MNFNANKKGHASKRYFLLAMHSSSETLGVGVLDIRNPERSRTVTTFPVGKQLSNNLFTCIQKSLPNNHWNQLARLAVATGPGSFTGTRLTVVMARTISQQIGCDLDGISSFSLMAPRLAKLLKAEEILKPFWIFKSTNRRGIIAGQYLIQNKSNLSVYEQILELKAPHLLSSKTDAKPALEATEDVAIDVNHLLEISFTAHKKGKKAPWNEVTPIYPTSPVKDF